MKTPLIEFNKLWNFQGEGSSNQDSAWASYAEGEPPPSSVVRSGWYQQRINREGQKIRFISEKN